MYRIHKFDNGMHYIPIEDKIVDSFHTQCSKRAICTLNNIPFHCAFMPQKGGGFFIYIGSKTMKSLQLKCDDEVVLTFKTDDSEYQFDMPEEFKEVLIQDPEADEIFHQLTDGNKRGIIYLVTMVKSSQKKIERALMITEKIKSGITSPRLIMKKD